MAYEDFVSVVHTASSRNYLQRVIESDKAACAEVALQWGRDYWDGERKHGYGGYRYDGRWRPIAAEMIKHYDLKPGARILDVGCGKGFLLYEFTELIPGAQVTGIDISQYAVDHGKQEVKEFLRVGNATDLPFEDASFDLVVSITTLHNLVIQDLWKALQEIERVGRRFKYIVVESYRNEREKVNLMYWQLTCRAFHTPQEWEWLFCQAGYRGDHSFIFFT